MKPTLKRLNVKKIEDADNVRFDYFTKKLWPKFNESLQNHNVIFCQSYFDFVRVRTFLKSVNAAASFISEYTE